MVRFFCFHIVFLFTINPCHVSNIPALEDLHPRCIVIHITCIFSARHATVFYFFGSIYFALFEHPFRKILVRAVCIAEAGSHNGHCAVPRHIGKLQEKFQFDKAICLY